MYVVKFNKTFVSGNLEGMTVSDFVSAVDMNHAQMYFNMYKKAQETALVHKGYGNTSSYVVSDIHIFPKEN
jgi:hypothetical protein